MMKRFTVLMSLICFAVGAFAQQQVIHQKASKHDLSKTGAYLLRSHDSRAAVLNEEFETWPPVDWTIIDGTESQGTQHWHQSNAGAPQNNVAKVLYDDGDATPRPQDEWLISPTVTVPNADPYLRFEINTSIYWFIDPNDNADINVKISVDDGATWTILMNEHDIENLVTYEWVEVLYDLTSYAGQEVQIAFQYVGTDAAQCSIDGVKIFTLNDHDLRLVDARVNFFWFENWTDSVNYPQSDYYGLSGFYGSIPVNQVQYDGAFIGFDASIKNVGAMDANPTLGISVKDNSDTEIFANDTTLENALSSQEMDTIPLIDPEFSFMGLGLGDYDFNFSVFEDTVSDAVPGDNEMSFTTSLTEGYYAHDNGVVTGSFSTDSYEGGATDGDIIGVAYDFFEQDTITKALVYISDQTSVGTGYNVVVYTVDGETGDYVELMTSAYITIDDASEVGVMHEVEFPEFPIVEASDGYEQIIVAVRYYVGTEGDTFYLGVDGTVPTNGHETKMFFVADDTWFYYGGSSVPIINIETVKAETAIAEESLINFSVYPNPTTGVATINNVKDATIKVYNMIGTLVYSVENADFTTKINLSDMAEGTYLVRVKTDKGVGMKKLNVVK